MSAGRYTLHAAAILKKFKVFEYLHEKGSSVINEKDKQGKDRQYFIYYFTVILNRGKVDIGVSILLVLKVLKVLSLYFVGFKTP